VTLLGETNLGTFCDTDPGDHSVVFFEKSEDRYTTLFEFVRKGLEIGDVVVYLTRMNEPRIVGLMGRYGIEARKSMRDGRLRILSVLFSSGGTHNPKRAITIGNLKREVSMLAREVKGRNLRIASSLPEHLQTENKTREILRLERVMLSVAGEKRVSILCAYNSRRLKRPSWFRMFPFLTTIHGKGAFISSQGSVVMDELGPPRTRSRNEHVSRRGRENENP